MPSTCVNNHYFEKILDTSNEWILDRTGIETRYFADEGEKTSDLALKASLKAIERAGIDKSDVDMIILATLSPEYFGMPSTATLLAQKLGISDVPAFDITTACSGYIYLLSMASAYIKSGQYKNILIVGAEKISSVLDFSDRSTCVLFGDGAGASIISRTDSKNHSILDTHISSGSGSELLYTPNDSNQFIHMKGNDIFKIAVRTLISDVQNILESNSIKPDQIDFFIPHQANLRIIKAVSRQLDFSEEQLVVTVQKYGNTSAASIPMAMSDLYESGRLKRGDLMLLDAFGGGLTWGSSLVHFDGD